MSVFGSAQGLLWGKANDGCGSMTAAPSRKPNGCNRSATVESSGRHQPEELHLSLLGDLQRVVDLDPEVPHGALKFAVTK